MAARAKEIKRFLILAEEESVRAETKLEASYYQQYGVVLAPPKNKVSVVCYSPTTTRYTKCKAGHY